MVLPQEDRIPKGREVKFRLGETGEFPYDRDGVDVQKLSQSRRASGFIWPLKETIPQHTMIVYLEIFLKVHP